MTVGDISSYQVKPSQLHGFPSDNRIAPTRNSRRRGAKVVNLHECCMHFALIPSMQYLINAALITTTLLMLTSCRASPDQDILLTTQGEPEIQMREPFESSTEPVKEKSQTQIALESNYQKASLETSTDLQIAMAKCEHLIDHEKPVCEITAAANYEVKKAAMETLYTEALERALTQ